jgi:hypothetical protein
MFGLVNAAVKAAVNEVVPEEVKQFGAKVNAVGSSLKDGVSNVANKVSAVAGSVKDGVSNFTNVFKDGIPRTENGEVMTGAEQANINQIELKNSRIPKKGIAKDTNTNPTQSMQSPE